MDPITLVTLLILIVAVVLAILYAAISPHRPWLVTSAVILVAVAVLLQAKGLGVG